VVVRVNERTNEWIYKEAIILTVRNQKQRIIHSFLYVCMYLFISSLDLQTIYIYIHLRSSQLLGFLLKFLLSMFQLYLLVGRSRNSMPELLIVWSHRIGSESLPYFFYDTFLIILVFYMCLIFMLINGFVDTRD